MTRLKSPAFRSEKIDRYNIGTGIVKEDQERPYLNHLGQDLQLLL